MSVYVDEPREYQTSLRCKIWCHMWADSSDELHVMADRIGLKREWVQTGNPSLVHYDLTPSKRRLAIKAGAVEKSLLQHFRERRAVLRQTEN